MSDETEELQSPPMTSAQAISAFDELVGAGSFQRTLYKSAIRVIQTDLNTNDFAHLAELFELGENDQSLFPSTPAWCGPARYRAGRLAVVLDHVVFFQRKAWRNSYKVYFALPGAEVTARFWNAVPGLGSIGFTIQSPTGEAHRIYLDPPRHVNLTEVSRAAEQPGVLEFADYAASLGNLTTPFSEILGDVGEMFAIMRSRRVAAQHLLIWRGIIARLAAGEAAPFSESDSSRPGHASEVATRVSDRTPTGRVGTSPVGSEASYFRHGTCPVKHRSAETAARCRRKE